MALSLAGALAAGAATSAGTSLMGKFFGSGSSSRKSKSSSRPAHIIGESFKPPGLSAGGLTAKPTSSGFNVTSSRGRRDIVGEIASTFPEQARALQELRAKVAPGMSDMRRVRLNEVDNARSKAIGDLRENLSARRVLGSSFASDALARAEAEFAQQKDRISAESFLQELELTHGLLNEEFNASRGDFTTKLTELNLHADIATRLATNATATLGDLTKAQMEIARLQSDGAGAFASKIIDPIAKTIGTEVQNFLSPKTVA